MEAILERAIQEQLGAFGANSVVEDFQMPVFRLPKIKTKDEPINLFLNYSPRDFPCEGVQLF